MRSGTPPDHFWATGPQGAGLHGTWAATATSLTLTDTDPGSTDVTHCTIALNGNTLTATGCNTTFNVGSGEVAAVFNVTFVRE